MSLLFRRDRRILTPATVEESGFFLCWKRISKTLRLLSVLKKRLLGYVTTWLCSDALIE